MSELSQLKIKRGQQRSALTRIKKFLESLDLENFTQKTHFEIKARMEKLQKINQSFEEIQDEIDLILNGKSEDQDYREEFEETFYSLYAEMENLLQISSETGSKASDEENNQIDHPLVDHKRVKLPTIELPTFDGQFRDWITYRDLFKSLIHQQRHLSNIEKFHYLKASLKGEALLLIDAIQISDENYEVAFNTLTDRYDNKKLLIHHHLKLIFDTPVIYKESLKELRKLTDDIRGNVSILTNLGIDTGSWDSWLLYLISTKLDNLTRREWEDYASDKEFPLLKDFYAFINQRCQFLEKLNCELPKTEKKTISKTNYRPPNTGTKSSLKTFLTASTQRLCPHCKMEHSLFNCSKFLDLPVKTRHQIAKQLKLCLNCLKQNHVSKVCIAGGCKKCGMKHNTLLHFENENNVERQSNCNKGADSQTKEMHVITASSVNNGEVLLSTAQVVIVGKNKQKYTARVLLDCGSQSNFITKDLFQRLGISSKKTMQNITGIGQQGCSLSEMVDLEIKSALNNFSFHSSFLIIDNIVNKLPQSKINVASLEIPENITLADPDFAVPGRIDMLLGATEFWNLLCIGQVKLNGKQPVLQKTRLGWVISGFIPLKQKDNKDNAKGSLSLLSLDDRLEKFWSIEDVPQNSVKAHESSFEYYFKKTILRRSNGHFEVGLPLKENAINLGNSFDQALRRFLQLEKRLNKSEGMKKQYQEFMEEYENLGHMSEITDDINIDNNLIYYLPHHGIFKESSITTKLRVVFDGSAKTDTGLSLNDILMSGQVLQNDLFSILLRFRKHSIVIASDIEKMYRQIYISPQYRDLQRIIWRSNSNEPIKKYRLNTVTYGTTSGSFLAIRCLFEVANRIERECPDISRIIKQDFYVDDLLTGGETVEEVLKLQAHLTSKMQEYGFPLRKWNSNHPGVIQSILKQSDNDLKHVVIQDSTTKTLGLYWDAKGDYLQYSINSKPNNMPTKRSILASVARIFDPLGLLSPVTILFKMLLQELWRTQVGWDESLPQNIFTKWNQYQSIWKHINEISVPRHVICSGAITLQLHGFCDASQTAYGACVYLVSTDQSGQKFVKLLCGKSKVAPLKIITLPRLELCGGLLLSRLVNKVVNSIDLQFNETYLWTDSQIALAWIAKEPNHWKNFVANRVAEIQELTKNYFWRHVSTKDNPADLVSRGMNAENLRNSDLWWNGPEWLTLPEAQWPSSRILDQEEDVPEQRQRVAALVSVQEDDLFKKYSNFKKLQHVMAYLLRFINNARKGNKKRHGQLEVEELEGSLIAIIRKVQKEVYSEELKILKTEKNLSKTSKLLRLNPMIDERGILRVGGRIQKSQLSFEEKHQIILPGSHHVTKLLVKHEHHRHLHAGAQTLLNIIRQRFWIIGGLTAVKGILRKCITCFRTKPRVYQHQMGQLPTDRVSPSHPFQNCGVDYAGPIDIKSGTLRNSKIIKAYICIFICFSTKAVHIELVSDLTSEAFLNTLKRFIARRGKPKNIYSDNGRNFVGAYGEIKRIENSSNISKFVAEESIKWHFIPPRSPHFGGLWEAAVKSAKMHLKRVVGNATLTFEELYTVLVQVEACLNSRPLSSMSDDPNDLNPLTPAHFLLARPITGFPDENDHPSHSRLRRYQHLVFILKHFWNRWSKEYISSLQHRNKWKGSSIQPKEGDLVLLVEESSSPLQWSLGRIIKLYPGADGTIRVAEVKTATGTTTRAIRKLCPLPQE